MILLRTAAIRVLAETPAKVLCVNQIVRHTAAVWSRTCAVVTLPTQDRPAHSSLVQPGTAVQVTSL